MANMQTVASRAAADPRFKAAVASQEPGKLTRKAEEGKASTIDNLAEAAPQIRLPTPLTTFLRVQPWSSFRWRENVGLAQAV